MSGLPAGVDLVILDCDGTLTDSEYVYNACAVDLLKDYGLNYTVEYALNNWMGHSFDNILKAESLKAGVELPLAELTEKFIKNTPAYQQKYLKEIPGALDAVKALQKHTRCCVASNGEKPNIVNSLKLLKFSEIFSEDWIFSKNDVANAKPAPDLFLHACRQMGSKPEKTVVVEDSISGVKAGNAAHMYTIGFCGLAHSRETAEEALYEAGADIVFSEWKDILIHINSLQTKRI